MFFEALKNHCHQLKKNLHFVFIITIKDFAVFNRFFSYSVKTMWGILIKFRPNSSSSIGLGGFTIY